jgi:hypothetical protein
MKNYITILFILVIITSLKLRSTGNYKYALNEDRNLYIEVYRSGLTGNMTSEYLTDSANFRVYLGTYNSKNASIHCKLTGDQIIVEKKLSDASAKANPLKAMERKTYSLKDLIRRDFY